MSRAVEKPPQIILAGESLSEARHNLRTPINHILGYGEMLIEDAEAQGKGQFLPDLRQILEDGKLRGAAARLLAMAGEILGPAAPTGPQIPAEPEVLSGIKPREVHPSEK